MSGKIFGSSAASSVNSGSPPWKYIRSRTAAGVDRLQRAASRRTSSVMFGGQRLVARDHDRRRPAARRDAEHLELDRQQRRLALGLGDVGIHAAHVGFDDRLAARVIVIQLGVQVAPEHDAAARRDRASARARPRISATVPVAWRRHISNWNSRSLAAA